MTTEGGHRDCRDVSRSLLQRDFRVLSIGVRATSVTCHISGSDDAMSGTARPCVSGEAVISIPAGTQLRMASARVPYVIPRGRCLYYKTLCG